MTVGYLLLRLNYFTVKRMTRYKHYFCSEQIICVLQVNYVYIHLLEERDSTTRMSNVSKNKYFTIGDRLSSWSKSSNLPPYGVKKQASDPHTFTCLPAKQLLSSEWAYVSCCRQINGAFPFIKVTVISAARSNCSG